MIKIIIPRNPTPKNDKARWTPKGNHWYSPKGKECDDIGWEIYCQYRDQCKAQGIKLRDPSKPLRPKVHFYYRLKRGPGPDRVNLEQFLLDALQKSAIVTNDRIVFVSYDGDGLTISKDIEGRTEITIDEG